jgi:hypothetical protein
MTNQGLKAGRVRHSVRAVVNQNAFISASGVRGATRPTYLNCAKVVLLRYNVPIRARHTQVCV